MISLPSTTNAILIASVLATSTSLLATSTEAFQSATQMPSAVGTSTSTTSGSELGYVIFDGDVEAATTTTATPPATAATATATTPQAAHGYAVANHDNERSFWLQALQNLEFDHNDDDNELYDYNGNENEIKNQHSEQQRLEKNQHQYNDRSMWTKIAFAFAPPALRENYLLDPTQTLREEAHLVRVGDADLDIAVAVPADVWKKAQRTSSTSSSSTSSTSPTQAQRQRSGRPSRRNQHTVTIRIDFPEGSSFDKDAFTFEDELSAVIRQVRLLERNANDRLSSLQTAN
mmetsp:Transcript_24641/g.54022  ORF Transcript_24641/g.54022 Transcript_24641/m.54022 type:complete len:289 (-) Transcript_24641:189-1055(-)